MQDKYHRVGLTLAEDVGSQTTYGFVDEARLDKLMKLLASEKKKLLFFSSICNLYATIFHVLQSYRHVKMASLPTPHASPFPFIYT
jgi:hypothetical protein